MKELIGRDSLKPALKQINKLFFGWIPLDEFPGINTPKSGFLSAFDHWWNSWANKQDNLIVIICGSAAAWMIRHIVNNKGRLPNRITQRIKLSPFTLGGKAKFLEAKKIKLGHFQIIQFYMVLGGTMQTYRVLP